MRNRESQTAHAHMSRPANAAAVGYEVLPGLASLEQPVDILIPAAVEHQITEENVRRVRGHVRLQAEQDIVDHGRISLRAAAYLIAVDRVVKACRARGGL
jgi:glutamate dehydrogenase/leucine dehydrogenase